MAAGSWEGWEKSREMEQVSSQVPGLLGTGRGTNMFQNYLVLVPVSFKNITDVYMLMG